MKTFIRFILFISIALSILFLINFSKTYNLDIGINFENFDSYFRSTPSTLQPKERVEIVWVSDSTMVNEQLESAGDYVAGTSRTSIYNDNLCLIYAHVPENQDDVQRIYALGHEVLHCFVGQYHD